VAREVGIAGELLCQPLRDFAGEFGGDLVDEDLGWAPEASTRPVTSRMRSISTRAETFSQTRGKITSSMVPAGLRWRRRPWVWLSTAVAKISDAAGDADTPSGLETADNWLEKWVTTSSLAHHAEGVVGDVQADQLALPVEDFAAADFGLGGRQADLFDHAGVSAEEAHLALLPVLTLALRHRAS
jgi:hypothetical protein